MDYEHLKTPKPMSPLKGLKARLQERDSPSKPPAPAPALDADLPAAPPTAPDAPAPPAPRAAAPRRAAPPARAAVAADDEETTDAPDDVAARFV